MKLYYSTIVNTILMTLGSFIAVKYFDLPAQMAMPLILLGMITLVMNQGVMNGVPTQENIVSIAALLSLIWVSFQFRTPRLSNDEVLYLIIASLSNLSIIVFFALKRMIKK